jgi:hypothetical protein
MVFTVTENGVFIAEYNPREPRRDHLLEAAIAASEKRHFFNVLPAQELRI